MKDVVYGKIRKQLKWKEKIIGKVFTKISKTIIIKKDYNPLSKDNIRLCEREGLSMNKTKDIITDRVIKELNWKERIVVKIFKSTFNKVYNISRINTFNEMLK